MLQERTSRRIYPGKNHLDADKEWDYLVWFNLGLGWQK